MVRHVPGYRGPVVAHAFGGGQSNPTFRLTAASDDYVLRRKPMGPLLAMNSPSRDFHGRS